VGVGGGGGNRGVIYFTFPILSIWVSTAVGCHAEGRVNSPVSSRIGLGA